MVKINTAMSSTSSMSSSSPKQRGGGISSRKAVVLFLTIPFIWILHETAWQQDSALQRRADNDNLRHSKSKTIKRMKKIIGIKDLADIAPVKHLYTNHTLDQASWDEAMAGREKVVDILMKAGLLIDLDVLKLLPTWDEVQKLYGDEPVILGLDRCQAFRKAHKPSNRFFAIAGQHNCGTNAMARYFKQNLAIPGNERDGFLPNVPWHKHGWEGLRHVYNFSFPANHDDVMPVVIVRDPYFWMHSMCESPYLMNWKHSEHHCPNLVKENGEGNPAKTMWGTYERRWDSLAHVWSEFYSEYEEADYPRLMIRFEGEFTLWRYFLEMRCCRIK